MAKAKAAGKALAVKTGGRQLGKVKDFRQELAEYAQEDGAREPASAGNNISIAGKEFSLGGGVVEEPLRVAVLDYVFENSWYDRKYDKDNPSPPACFAVNRTEAELVPDERSPLPQAETCAQCPRNVFGSADVGRGKDCKNQRRLALINTDVKEFDAGYVKEAEVAFIRLPPTSLKLWKGYVKKLSDGLQLPLWSVITELTLDPEVDYAVVVPQLGDELTLDKPLKDALLLRRQEVQPQLLEGFDVSNYEPPTAKPTRQAKPAARASAKPAAKFAPGKRKF
jgi:hypothetical protein